MTSAWSPKRLPDSLLHYMSTRGTDRIMFASDYPVLSMERCLGEAGQARPHRRGPRRLALRQRRVVLLVPPDLIQPDHVGAPWTPGRSTPTTTTTSRSTRSPVTSTPSSGTAAFARCRTASGCELLIGGKVNRFVPNPTFDPIIVPGCLDPLFRGQDPRGGDPRSLMQVEPLADHPEYRDREQRLAVMDEQGLGAALLFPTLGCGVEEALRDDIRRHDGQPLGLQPLARGGLGLRLSTIACSPCRCSRWPTPRPRSPRSTR